MFRVDLCRLARVMMSVSMVTMCRVRVVGGLFVTASLMVFRRFAVMFCGMFVMRGRVLVVLVRLVGRHPVFLLVSGESNAEPSVGRGVQH